MTTNEQTEDEKENRVVLKVGDIKIVYDPEKLNELIKKLNKR